MFFGGRLAFAFVHCGRDRRVGPCGGFGGAAERVENALKTDGINDSHTHVAVVGSVALLDILTSVRGGKSVKSVLVFVCPWLAKMGYLG